MENRYGFFRWFGYALLITGCLVILGALVAAYIWSTAPTFTVVGVDIVRGEPNRAQGATTAIIGISVGSILLFLSQFISILLGIERNTRATAAALHRLIESRSGRTRPD